MTMPYLKNHDLLQTDKHTIYSLRHTFKDRIRKHRIPSELQNFLMGHEDKGMGSHYGAGYSLQQIKEYIQLIESDWVDPISS